jgi:hypothetical protein
MSLADSAAALILTHGEVETVDSDSTQTRDRGRVAGKATRRALAETAAITIGDER